MDRRLRVGLVHGGGSGVFDESETAIRMLAAAGARATYICVNDCGAEFPGTLHHWGSLHPDQFGDWKALRKRNGLPDGYVTWSISRSTYVDRIVRNWTGGSSGLHGFDIALNGIHLDCAVGCGVPMDARPNEFSGEEWGQSQRYRKAWENAQPEFRGRAKSMSGWTRKTLGEPSMEWLTEMAKRVGATV